MAMGRERGNRYEKRLRPKYTYTTRTVTDNLRMGRKPNGKPRGRAPGFSGEKLDWLLGMESDFRTQNRSQFYDGAVKKFFIRYGRDLGFEQNISGNIEDWEPRDRRAGLTGTELEEELEFEANQNKTLRAVSPLSCIIRSEALQT
jgi:hypothetical protein